MNPVRVNFSPFFKALVKAPVKAFRAFSADDFETLASFDMIATNSAFVIPITSLSKNNLFIGGRRVLKNDAHHIQSVSKSQAFSATFSAAERNPLVTVGDPILRMIGLVSPQKT